LQKLLYEHPLNERTRTLLRISHLFDQFEYHLPSSSPWQSRSAVQALLDITSILARADIKTEMIKQLDQHAKTLRGVALNPDVDQERLNRVLEDIEHTSQGSMPSTGSSAAGCARAISSMALPSACRFPEAASSSTCPSSTTGCTRCLSR